MDEKLLEEGTDSQLDDLNASVVSRVTTVTTITSTGPPRPLHHHVASSRFLHHLHSTRRPEYPLIFNRRVYEHVKACQQVTIPIIGKKVGRVEYISLLALIMIGPMAWNGLSFLFSVSSPLPPVAYFDGCYVRNLPYDVNATNLIQWNATYLECLACNGDELYVYTNNTQFEGISQVTRGFGATASFFAIVISLAYVWFSIVSLRFGTLLAFGVYTRITPAHKSKVKIVTLLAIVAYAVLVTYYAVDANKQLAVFLQSIAVGNTWGGCKQYNSATGNITSGDFVFATFDPINPVFSTIGSDTTTPKDLIIRYGSAFAVYIPIFLAFFSVLNKPYACLYAAELFVEDEVGGGGGGGGGGAVVDNSKNTDEGEQTIAKLIESNIKYRIDEFHLAAAVYVVRTQRNEAATSAQKSLPIREKMFAGFLVWWAQNMKSSEDLLLVKRVVKEACVLERDHEQKHSDGVQQKFVQELADEKPRR
ncbi:transmembrane protein, putative [Bodo saltans]|uniref:Transmembrane protein, putative n=1 Tax=Bodo saltans TaxID=75058 RepID=A0A0S4IH53_BODSA|nr:transmembrane protein, putative [Bodo saltans]|eukprot:CUE57594.1 transmembrane protein, putative [Bodo saltans]